MLLQRRVFARSLIISSGQFRAETEYFTRTVRRNDIIAAGACTDIGYLHAGGREKSLPRSLDSDQFIKKRRGAMNGLSAECG